MPLPPNTQGYGSLSQLANFEFIGGKLVFKDSNTNEKLYRTCPPLNYILNQKAQLHNNGVIKMVDPSTKKEFKIKQKDYEQLLKYPNPLQTQSQFRAQVTTLLQAYPYCAVLKVIPIGFDKPTQLWILPNEYLNIERNDRMLFTNDVRNMIKRVTFSYGKTTTELDKDMLYFFTANTTSFDDLFAPQPPLEAIKQHCINVINILDSRDNIIQHQGARGILSNTSKDNISTIQLDPKDKEDLHNDWAKYGLKSDQKRIIISNASLQWQQIGLAFSELQLLEQAKDDIMNICAGLNFKFQLLPQGSETAFNNQKDAYPAQYRDFTIPEAENYIRQYNDCVGSEKFGVLHIIDFSDVSYLKQDAKVLAEVRKINTEACINQFMHNMIKYDALMLLLDNADLYDSFKGKFFGDLTPEEQQLFIRYGSNNTRSGSAQSEANNTNQAGN